jgi:transcriptional regulator with XRE-family HTH domain
MTYTFDITKLTSLRQEKFWTQEDLAAAAGLSVRTVQRMENGNGGSLESWKAIAAAFDVDLNFLQSHAISKHTKTHHSAKISVGTLLAYAGVLAGCGFGWGKLFRTSSDFQAAINDNLLLTLYVTVMTALCLMAPFIRGKLTIR